MTHYERYPFLSGARSLANITAELKYPEITFSYFDSNLSHPFFSIENTDRVEVNVFLNCMILLKKINHNYVSRKFISNFSKRFKHFFTQDISNMQIRNEILDFFNFDFNNYKFRNDIVEMSIVNYLLFSRDISDMEYRLINQQVENGMVIITNNAFINILGIRLIDILLKKINGMGSVDYISLNGLEQQITDLTEKYKKYQYSQQTVTTHGIFPPCIKNLIVKADEKKHLEHVERLVLATYLLSKNYSEEYILNIYSKLSDYRESVTKKHLKSLDRFKTYSCQKIETEGLCFKDDICIRKKLTNPYFY